MIFLEKILIFFTDSDILLARGDCMFALRLKELREKKGLSQKAFSAKLGVSQSTVGMWESQKREPNFETTEKIANFFGVSTDYLLGRTDEPKPVDLDKELEGVRFALYSESEELTDDDKQAVLDFVRFLKSKNKKEE